MADDYATAYDAPTTTRTPTNGATPPGMGADEPDNPKPGLWAYLPMDAPASAQRVNDALVKHLLIRPLNSLDQGLKQARYSVKGAAFAAQTLLFRSLDE